MTLIATVRSKLLVMGTKHGTHAPATDQFLQQEMIQPLAQQDLGDRRRRAVELLTTAATHLRVARGASDDRVRLGDSVGIDGSLLNFRRRFRRGAASKRRLESILPRASRTL